MYGNWEGQCSSPLVEVYNPPLHRSGQMLKPNGQVAGSIVRPNKVMQENRNVRNGQSSLPYLEHVVGH